MNTRILRTLAVSASLFGLVACGSQESDFVSTMTQDESNGVTAEQAACAYEKLAESEGEDFIAAFLDGVGKGIPPGAVKVAGAMLQCAVELNE